MPNNYPPSLLADIESLGPALGLAQIRIFEDYGDTVSILTKAKLLLKFGEADVSTSRQTLALLGAAQLNETYVSTNAITHFASATDADTGSLKVEGHTIDASGNFTFVTQTVTLAGHTKTALTTPLARCSRAYNAGSAAWTGPVYVAEDVTFTLGVPQTATAVHLVIPTSEQTSFKAATTISDTDYWIVTNVFGSILKKTSGFVDFRLEVREKGGLFLTKVDWSAASAGVASVLVSLDPPLVIPPNADVRITALTDASAVCSGWMNGYLAETV